MSITKRIKLINLNMFIRYFGGNNALNYIEKFLIKELRPFQKEIIELLENQEIKQLIVLAARQIGTTSIVLSYILWFALSYRDKNILLTTSSLEDGANKINKIKGFYDDSPNFIKDFVKIINLSTKEIRFDNGSTIKLVSSNAPDFLCSESADLFFIDNTMFIDSFQDLHKLQQVYCSINKGGKILMVSAASEQGGIFSHIWKNEDTWIKRKYIFNQVPGRDWLWLFRQKQFLALKTIAKDMLCYI